MVRITLAAAAAALLTGALIAPATAQTAAQSQCSAPLRQFIVYFPAGKSDLTTDGETVLQQAVAYGGGSAAFSVIGYIDGTEADILGLERTASVSQALNKSGVPNSKITIASAGKDKMAIPSDKPEPLNRRASVSVCKA